MLKTRIFHLLDRFDSDSKSEARKASAAYPSWDRMYETGDLIPIHVWDGYPRNAKETIGDPRPLPYLKDLLQKFLDASDGDSICLWSNDDSWLHPNITHYCRFHCSVWGAVSFFRVEFNSKIPSGDFAPEEIARLGRGGHIGRDAFAFHRNWLINNWDLIPDSVLAASMWDIHMACLIRLTMGIKTTNANIGEQIFAAEAAIGYTAHIAHQSAWNMPNPNSIPSNAHNGRLFKDFAAKHCPELKVTAEGNLA